MRRILWVKMGGLWPPNTGGRLRSFHLIAELARRHEVTLVTTHAAADDPGELARRLPRCRVLSLPSRIPKTRSARFAWALLRSSLSRLPVDVAKFRDRAVARTVRRLIASGEADLCVADFLSSTANVPLEGPVPAILFEHNVEHVIWKRMSGLERRPLVRLGLEIEWRKMRRCEARACARAGLTLAVSDLDRDLLREGAPGARIETIPTGVDTSFFAPSDRVEEAGSVVFTGSMDWHPNEDAVLFFMDAILPRVRARAPGASFTVVGRNPGRQLLEAARGAGVTVTGTVADVRPQVAAAAVYVVPLRIGGGTRLKIFEALAMGKAVVSTTVGAEGLPLVPGEHFIREDAPEEFARAVADLLRDPARRAALGKAGRRLVTERYSWAQVARRLEDLCEEAVLSARGRPAPAPARAAAAPVRPSIRRRIPGGLADALRLWRRVGTRRVASSWGRLLGDALGAGKGRGTWEPTSARAVLFVCHGNIIRSPMASFLLRRLLAGSAAGTVSIASAGLHAIDGRRADPRAIAAADRLGISLREHRARALTGGMVAQADAIFAMDRLNRAELVGRYPEARHKVFLLGAWGGARGGRREEIRDPFLGDEDDVVRCYERLGGAVDAVARALGGREGLRKGGATACA